MSVETFSVNDAVTVSPAAAEHFAEQLKKHQGKVAIRMSMKKSGCTGYRYVIDEVDEVEAEDVALTLSNGVALYIDPRYLTELQGLEIDYAQDGLNRNLVLNNPNVKDACGCGESVGF